MVIYLIINLDFWESISIYRTHPIVKFNKEFMMHVIQDDETYFYSPIKDLNNFYDNILEVPIVSVIILKNFHFFIFNFIFI
jgi:hypothetical protein